MASLTRGGVELLAFGRQFPTLGQGRQPDVDLAPVLQALGAPLPAPAPAQALQQGHRPVLQVTKVDTVTDTVFMQPRTRHKLWLSDGDRWIIGYAAQLEGASAGCLVRVTNYSSNFELTVTEMEIVGQPQPLIGAPKSMPMGKPLPNDAIQPPSLPPPPSVAEIEARLAAATVSAAPTATPTTASAAPTTTISAATSAVELDVGGTSFKTTLVTLARHPHTFFGALAKNRGDATSAIFIDRDPTHFRHILNYLRSGVLTAPADDDAKRELLVEAEFYGMQSFARALCAPELDLTQHLDAAALAERDEEARIRAAFASGDAEAIGQLDRYVGLVDIFKTYAGGIAFAAPPPVDSKSTLLYSSLEQTAPLGREGAPATCASTDAVLSNFKRLYPQVFERLKPLMEKNAPIFIAGGSALLALTALDTDVAAGRHAGLRPVRTRHTTRWSPDGSGVGDVDIFVHAGSPEACTNYARQIWNALAVDDEYWRFERSRGVLNMARLSHSWAGATPTLTVQVVLRHYASPAEVLTCFDVDCCCVGISYYRPNWREQGWRVWALPRAVRALQTSRNTVNSLHSWPRSAAYEIRLTKYACRGFAVFCPGLDVANVDHALVRAGQFSALSGVARLLHLANLLETSRPASFDDAKATLIKVGINVKYNLSGLYDTPVHTLPGDEPTNKGSAFTQIDNLAGGTPEDVDRIRRMHPRDIAWRVLSPVENYIDEDRYEIDQASAPLRDVLWAAIADVGHDHLDIPRRIEWDNTRNQREYLNARDDGHAAIYYAHAYKY